jgi:hypothetical protein
MLGKETDKDSTLKIVLSDKATEKLKEGNVQEF